ncbi:CD27 antigen [Arapaima gigas]
MQFPWGVWLLSLSLFPASSLGHVKCDVETQYAWPHVDPVRCCDRCKPGQRMDSRCTAERGTQCRRCGPDYYSDTVNIDQSCKPCTDCSMGYMVYVKNCTASSNSVCSCMPGYRCESSPCVNCVPERAETGTGLINPFAPTPPPTATLLLSLCLLCVSMSMLLICITFASRRHLAKWKTKGLTVFWLSKDTAEEDAQTPIQEEGGKPEKCDAPDC